MELKKVVDYAVVMADGPQILVESILDQARSKTNCRNSLIQTGARKSTPASRKAVSGRLGILRTQLVQGVRCLLTQEWSLKWDLGLCIQGDSILQFPPIKPPMGHRWAKWKKRHRDRQPDVRGCESLHFRLRQRPTVA